MEGDKALCDEELHVQSWVVFQPKRDSSLGPYAPKSGWHLNHSATQILLFFRENKGLADDSQEIPSLIFSEK